MRAFCLSLVLMIIGGAGSATASGHFGSGNGYGWGYGYGNSYGHGDGLGQGNSLIDYQRLLQQFFYPGQQHYPTSRASCANVRCASGTRCVETHSGPRCYPAYQPQPQPYLGYNPFPVQRTTCAQILCQRGTQCVQRGQQAVCVRNPVRQPRPVACNRAYRPVCAVPQTFNCITRPCIAPPRTFSNACTAWAAGHRVIYRGQCR